MDRLILLLKKLNAELVKKENVKQIFYVSTFLEKNYRSIFSFIDDVDISRVLKCFYETLLYLDSFINSNDDNFYACKRDEDNTIELVEHLYDIKNLLDGNFDYYFHFFERQACEVKADLVQAQELTLMFALNSYVTKSIDRLVDCDLKLINKEKGDVFYRGHGDSDYKIIPSMFRNFNEQINSGILNYKTMYSLYEKVNFINKYYYLLEDCKNLDLKSCAFAQHSMAYSPLLDLTSNPVVALSFATMSLDNVNQYVNKEAAVLKFVFNDKILEAEDIDLERMNIVFKTGKLKPDSFLNGNPLYYSIPQNFTPVVRKYSPCSNDRMKYQKGAFLFFSSCVVVNGYILLPYKIGNITKYLIKKGEKDSLNKKCIYNIICDKYEHYNKEHLMDPYKYFSEITRKFKFSAIE